MEEASCGVGKLNDIDPLHFSSRPDDEIPLLIQRFLNQIRTMWKK